MELIQHTYWHMAHRILGYNGLCGTLHGHTYQMEVVVEGSVDKKTGMLCDFAELKSSIGRVAMDIFDHSIFLSQEDPLVEAIRPYSSRMVVANVAATAENLAQVVFNLLAEELILGRSSENDVELKSLRVWETPKSSVVVSIRNPEVQIVEHHGFALGNIDIKRNEGS